MSGSSNTLTNEQSTIEVNNLKMYFPVRRGVLKRKVGDVKAIDGVSFSIRQGETLGLVGESGCGKTTVGRCIIRVYKPTSGEIVFKGTDISAIPDSKLHSYRRNMAMIFQDPYSSLDPRMNSGKTVGEPLIVHKLTQSKGEYNDRVDELFTLTGLNPNMRDRFPHEFSGGQRQRLSIARALAGAPSLIVCDEPISALDVSMQAQILRLLQELQEKNSNMSYLFISHDLLAVQYISQRVAVMYLGRTVETAPSQMLYSNTMHPYSQALLSAQPVPDPVAEETRQRIILEGDIPTPLNPPPGCSFNTRCPIATQECCESEPVLRDMGSGHYVACHRV